MTPTWRAHSDPDGGTWYGTPGVDRAKAPLAPAGFATLAAAAGATVRLLGTPGNAPLVLTLAAAGCPVELGSPALVPGLDPAAVLQALRRAEVGQQLAGHWHHLDAHDRIAYALVAELARSGGAATALSRRLLHRHAAWPALAFALPHDAAAAARLAAAIVDPRWFLHPRRPGRPSRLQAYLGLSPRAVAAALAGAPTHPRTVLALEPWHVPGALDGPRTAPRAFLARMALEAPTLALGATRASRTLVALVARVWLARVGPAGAAFDPARFFPDPAMQAAWEAHQAAPVDPLDPVGAWEVE